MRLPSEADTPIESFGPYDVYEELGAGGMAKVHRAKKRGIAGFQRPVALKRLLEPLADDEKFIKSFVREARLASYLHHANIIQIYDLGRVEKVYFIAMELVHGWDLRQVLKQTAYAAGPMPVSVMMYITRQLCDALNYAHALTDEAGEPLRLVHCDISPANLLVADSGHLKIIDFGIAKAAPSSLHTQSGRLKGKFAYMAPEVIRGRSFDHRSDLFAVGIVAYELLTARPLFAAKNEYDTLRSITKLDVPPPSSVNPDCPPELDEVVLKALAKTPVSRWSSAGDMLSALDQVAKKRSLEATNRDVAEWASWAFEQPLQRQRVSRSSYGDNKQQSRSDRKSDERSPDRSPSSDSPSSNSPSSNSPSSPRVRLPLPAIASSSPEPEPVEPVDVEQAWGQALAWRGRLSQQLTAQITNVYADHAEMATRSSLPEFQFSDYSDTASLSAALFTPTPAPTFQSRDIDNTLPREGASNSQVSARKLSSLLDVEERPDLREPALTGAPSMPPPSGIHNSDDHSFGGAVELGATLTDDVLSPNDTLTDGALSASDTLIDGRYDSLLKGNVSPGTGADGDSSGLTRPAPPGSELGETGAVPLIPMTNGGSQPSHSSRPARVPMYVVLALLLGVGAAAAVYLLLTRL